MAGGEEATAQDLAFRLVSMSVGSMDNGDPLRVDIPPEEVGAVARELLGIATIAIVSLADETKRDEQAVLYAIEHLIDRLKRGETI